MFELRHLRVLKEVADRGSFSAAAKALSYTQPAVSQQIAALEHHVGMRLVDRGTRGAALTEAGRTLVGHATTILDQVAAAEADLEAVADLRGGEVRIGSFPSAGASIIPVALVVFRERHPAVDPVLAVAEPPELRELLLAGEIDVALLLEPDMPQRLDPRIDRVAILDDPMWVALPGGHPAAAREAVRLRDLAEESWIASPRPLCPDRALFLHACRGAGFEPRVVLNSDDYAATQGFVAAGLGLAMLPQLALHTVRDDIAVRRFAERRPKRTIVAATLRDRHRSAATRAMLDVLAEVGAAHPAEYARAS